VYGPYYQKKGYYNLGKIQYTANTVLIIKGKVTVFLVRYKYTANTVLIIKGKVTVILVKYKYTANIKGRVTVILVRSDTQGIQSLLYRLVRLL